jgi:hypothetical protein
MSEADNPAGARSGGGARLAIGALAKATGIPIETLRTWETRYGYPIRERKPSGHPVYPLASVVGGEGAPKPAPGVSVIAELRALDAWARGAAAAS